MDFCGVYCIFSACETFMLPGNTVPNVTLNLFTDITLLIALCFDVFVIVYNSLKPQQPYWVWHVVAPTVNQFTSSKAFSNKI